MNQKQESLTDYFGEVISSYSRAQAIEDGLLVDVSQPAFEAGFNIPTAVTNALWAEIVRGKGDREIYRDGRLFDVLNLARIAAKRGGERVAFTVKIGARNHRLIAICGPGDEHEPVITIGKPEDF